MPSLASLTAGYECSLESIAAFVDGLDHKVKSFEGNERRAHARYVVAIPCIVQPLDEKHRPQDKPFDACTRDISIGGIGLLHTRPVSYKILGVTLTLPNRKQIQPLVKVQRCRPIETYYDIAGEFVVDPKLNQPIYLWPEAPA